MNATDQSDTRVKGPGSFRTTRWTLVVAYRDGDEEASRQALEELCRIYWKPIYFYFRHQGEGEEEAKDLAQALVCDLIDRRDFKSLDPEKGTLRSFLRKAAWNILAKEIRKRKSEKRGGNIPHFSLDALQAEGHYREFASNRRSPDQEFMREWARTVLTEVMESLRASYASRGKDELFEALKEFIPWGRTDQSQKEAAARLGISPAAARTAVHRMRARYGELLMRQVRDTVKSPDEVEEEIQALTRALSE